MSKSRKKSKSRHRKRRRTYSSSSSSSESESEKESRRRRKRRKKDRKHKSRSRKRKQEEDDDPLENLRRERKERERREELKEREILHPGSVPNTRREYGETYSNRYNPELGEKRKTRDARDARDARRRDWGDDLFITPLDVLYCTLHVNLHPQNLHVPRECDSNPIRMSSRPLQLIDGALCIIGKDWICMC